MLSRSTLGMVIAVNWHSAKYLAVSYPPRVIRPAGWTNANAFIATQVPRNKSCWALGTLSIGGVSGALLGPLAGGLFVDHYSLRTVFVHLFFAHLLYLFTRISSW